MNNLSIVTENVVVDSRQVAEWTGKEHKHIMRDIRNEIKELGELGESIFGLWHYKDQQNQDRPCYTMNRDGVMQLALKYDAVVRYKVIQKLNELEKKLKEDMSIEDLLKAKWYLECEINRLKNIEKRGRKKE